MNELKTIIAHFPSVYIDPVHYEQSLSILSDIYMYLTKR